MPDPLAMSPDMLASPAHVIRGLSYQIAYARDRVLQGDWTEKYALGRIQVCAAVAEDARRWRLRWCPDRIRCRDDWLGRRMAGWDRLLRSGR